MIDLTIEGDGQNVKTRRLHALVKDYQVETLRRDISAHVDLLAIDPDKEVAAEVPLEFVGKPKGTIDGGQLRIVMAQPVDPREAERHPGLACRSTTLRWASAT